MSYRGYRGIGVAALLLWLAVAVVRLVQGPGSIRVADGDPAATNVSRVVRPAQARDVGAARQGAQAAVAGTGASAVAADSQSRRPAARRIGWPTYAEAAQLFAQEQSDPAWSAAAEARILGNLPLIPDLGLLDAEVECRESLCRIRLLFPPGVATTFALRRIYAFARDIGLGPLASSPGIDAGGLPSLRLFLRRNAG